MLFHFTLQASVGTEQGINHTIRLILEYASSTWDPQYTNKTMKSWKNFRGRQHGFVQSIMEVPKILNESQWQTLETRKKLSSF